jgi:hypothetical protein
MFAKPELHNELTVRPSAMSAAGGPVKTTGMISNASCFYLREQRSE